MSAFASTDAPSDQLLRTLASVPVSSPVLALGCGSGRHAEALLRLGFPMHACDPRAEAVEQTRAVVQDLVDDETAQSCVQHTPLPALADLDATFDWVIADETEAYLEEPSDLQPLLETAHGLLAPGGWLYLTLPAVPGDDDATDGIDDVATRFDAPDLAIPEYDTPYMEVESPTRVEENGAVRLHALYRRVKRPATG
jgi:SAM-dependent methyltransferase